ncbi:MAG TPA: tetratricopeptide repeat protein, partial [Chryseolinea sp.]|nr:tetratricopeptide repeat protein [Chryseolinea sp.]
MRGKSSLLLCFLLLCGSFGLAQTRVDWYGQLYKQQNVKKTDVVLDQKEKKLKQAVRAQDYDSQTTLLIELSVLHLTRTYDYGKAMDLLIRSGKIEDSLGLNEQRVFTYLTMARIFNAVSAYDKSTELISLALHVFPKNENPALTMLILNDLGKTNMLAGKSDKALANFNDVLSLKDHASKPEFEAEALFNLGKLLTSKGKYNEALKKHKQALALSRSVNDKQNEARSLNEVGELYRLMKNVDKSMANHTVALRLRESMSDKRGIAESLNNISVLYYEQENFPAAIAALQQADTAGRESQDQHQLARSYEYLSQCYERLGDYKEALRYSELYIAISELVQGEINEHNSLEKENRYQLDKKEARIGSLELDRIAKQTQLENEKQFRYLLYFLFGAALMIIGIVTFFYIDKRRSAKILE